MAIIPRRRSEERALAIINETKKVIPNKPIRYVVNSHWHIDHSGGLRTFVAEGATIITQPRIITRTPGRLPTPRMVQWWSSPS